MSYEFDLDDYVNAPERMEAFTAAMKVAREQRHQKYLAEKAAKEAGKVTEQRKRAASYAKHFR
jgi:hypothetical protein